MTPTGKFVVRLHLRVFEILLSLCNGARSLEDSCQETYRDPFHAPLCGAQIQQTLSFPNVTRTQERPVLCTQ